MLLFIFLLCTITTFQSLFAGLNRYSLPVVWFNCYLESLCTQQNVTTAFAAYHHTSYCLAFAYSTSTCCATLLFNVTTRPVYVYFYIFSIVGPISFFSKIVWRSTCTYSPRYSLVVLRKVFLLSSLHDATADCLFLLNKLFKTHQ